jgi:large subunit ribosomal protein L5
MAKKTEDGPEKSPEKGTAKSPEKGAAKAGTSEGKSAAKASDGKPKGGAKAAADKPAKAAADKPAKAAVGKPAKAAAAAGAVPEGARAKGESEGDGAGNGKAGKSAKRTYVPRLKQRYVEDVVPKLKREFGIGSEMAVPRLEKISLNMGVGEAISNIKILDAAVEEMAAVAGQRPTVTRAQKSIAAFKLRAGMPIGCRVTLRGERMWEFLDRLISVALPRVRDFRGVPTKSFDGRGNYTLGIRDHLIFPEVDYNKVEKSKGMNITIVTTAGNDERAQYLLRELGMPFQR